MVACSAIADALLPVLADLVELHPAVVAAMELQHCWQNRSCELCSVCILAVAIPVISVCQSDSVFGYAKSIWNSGRTSEICCHRPACFLVIKSHNRSVKRLRLKLSTASEQATTALYS